MQKPAPKKFFKEATELSISEKCSMIRYLPCNEWVFEVMELHQTLDRFRNCSWQRWCFNKKGNNILVLCYGENDKQTVFLEGNIGNHHEAFKNLVIYVVNGKCLLPEEYELYSSRQASA